MTLDELYLYIDVNPLKGRRSVFMGTNITPEHILKDIGKGMTKEDILKEHPQLTEKHLEAAILFAETFPTDAQVLALVLARIGLGF